MSQEGNTQIPGKLDQSITSSPHFLLHYISADVLADSGLDNGLITGQGQEVTVTGCGDKNTCMDNFFFSKNLAVFLTLVLQATMPPGSDEDAFQKLFRLLQAGKPPHDYASEQVKTNN
jgi:hypothetical protein